MQISTSPGVVVFEVQLAEVIDSAGDTHAVEDSAPIAISLSVEAVERLLHTVQAALAVRAADHDDEGDEDLSLGLPLEIEVVTLDFHGIEVKAPAQYFEPSGELEGAIQTAKLQKLQSEGGNW